MPRYGNSPGRACGAGEIKRLAAESRQTATEDSSTVVWIPSPPGSRGHPTRPCLTRGERGNPVKVRWRRFGRRRQADCEGSWIPWRDQEPQQANDGGRKVAGKRER